MGALPFPDIQRADGVLNFAAYFPTNMCPPDIGRCTVGSKNTIAHPSHPLGPKAYNAEATIIDDKNHGSTRLHMDYTDAVNIMLFASGASLSAKWDLFRPEDTDIICQFIKKWCGHSGPGHPIHSQQIYLTPPLLDLLYTEHGIRPYTVHQHPFDAVHIPAGCIHQVNIHLTCRDSILPD